MESLCPIAARVYQAGTPCYSLGMSRALPEDETHPYRAPKEYMHFRICPVMKEKFRKIAHSKGITGSEMVRRLVINYFEQVTYFDQQGIDLLKGS